MQVRLRETRWVWEFFRKGRRWAVRNVQGKTEKVSKLTKFAQNMRFSRLRQVACKLPRPTAKTLKRKLWKKNILSVFHDWKFHSWESHELSRENLYVPLVTGPSIREQVTNLSREKHENPNFEKYSKSFSRLKHLLANESPVSREESLWWTRNWGMRLVLPVTESPE